MMVFHDILEPDIKINLIQCFIIYLLTMIIMIIFIEIFFIVIIGRSDSIIKFEVLQIQFEKRFASSPFYRVLLKRDVKNILFNKHHIFLRYLLRIIP